MGEQNAFSCLKLLHRAGLTMFLFSIKIETLWGNHQSLDNCVENMKVGFSKVDDEKIEKLKIRKQLFIQAY